MKFNNCYLSGLVSVFMLVCACTKLDMVKPAAKKPAPTASFFTVSGQQILTPAGAPATLRGVAFGNEVWSDKVIPNTHHTEIDFARVKAMNMNLVRFYLNYKTLESDASPYRYNRSGWDWINQNIAWAKKHGVYLILNIHVPQGGYQSQGKGDALWNDIENQNRLVAMWKAIAEKYRNEPQIVGYGLVNEPVPNQDMNQWQQLAQRLATTIRAADANHILFVERAIYVKGKSENADLNFPVINDNNTAYEFHFYDPIEYTHQLFDWSGYGEGGAYPDENVIALQQTQWYTGTFNNPIAPAGNSNWQYVEGQQFLVQDANIKYGLPALVGANVNGRVYFDNIEIKEFDGAGNFVRTVDQLNLNSTSGWSYWSSNNSGTWGLANTTGADDQMSLYIEQATADCNISNYNRLFEPRQGYRYQIVGWMKGDNIATQARCMLRVDFLTTQGPVLRRNKAYLEYIFQRYVNWKQQRNVPLFMGEFGAGIHCFSPNKGGLQWVGDMVDLLKAFQIPFTYHTYHEDSFGLYYGYGSLPDPTKVNQPLIDLLTHKLQP